MVRRNNFDDVMQELVQLRRQVRALSSPQLAHSSFDSGAGHSIDEVDPETGQTVAAYGTQYDGAHGTVVFSGPTPPEPVPATTEAAPAVLTGAWNGEFVGGPLVVPTMDWSHVEVHASQVPGYSASFAETLIGTINTPRGGKVTAVVEPGTWYVRLVSRSLAGKRSDASPAVMVVIPELVDTTQIEADLEAANTAISAAAADAAEAFDLADEATRKITISTTVPAGTGVPGALWFQKNGSGAFIGQWEWLAGSPGSWAPRTTDGGIISNLAVTNLVAGTGTMTQALIDKLYSDVVVSRKMIAGNVYIGTGGNLWPVEMNDALWPTTSGITKATTGGHNNGPSLLIPASATQISSVYGIAAADRTKLPELEPGVTYRLKIRARASTAIPVGGASVQIRLYPATGTTFTAPTVATISNTDAVALNTWATLEGMFTVPETSANLYTTFAVVKEATTTGTLRFSGLALQEATTGDLIAENSITAPKIVASEELTAKVAEFLVVNADMVNTNELWADTAWIAAARTHILTVLQNTNGAGYTSTITGQGLKVTRTIGGVTYDVIRLGTFGADYLSVSDGTGNALAAISGTGDFGSQSAYVQGDVFAGGRRLTDDLGNGPRGEVTYADYVFPAPGWNTTSGGGAGIMELSFTAWRGRAYRLFSTIRWYVSVAGPERAAFKAVYKIGGTGPSVTVNDGAIGPQYGGQLPAEENRLAWARVDDIGGRFIPFPYNSTVTTEQSIQCRILIYGYRLLLNGVLWVEYIDGSVIDLGVPAVQGSHFGLLSGPGPGSTIPSVVKVSTTYTSAQFTVNRFRRLVGNGGAWNKVTTDGFADALVQGLNPGATYHYKTFITPPAAFYTELTQATLLNVDSITVTMKPKNFPDGMGTMVLGLADKAVADGASFSNPPGVPVFHPAADVTLGAWPNNQVRTVELPYQMVNILRTTPNKVFSLGANIPDSKMNSAQFQAWVDAADFSFTVNYRKT